MTRRFSSHELSFLRNKIPIAHVIEDLLSLPTRNNTGKLSFACPLCKGFDTSINYKHNLARCFECRQNFNPIELVMHQRHTSFVDSVKWLKRHDCKPESKDTSIRDTQGSPPVNIGDILPKILPSLVDQKNTNPSLEAIIERILNLELQVQKLYLLIEKQSSAYQR
ncbi:MAG: hypothetical protein H8D96_20950 [Desulfobacterales bacterium]|uniref:Zinc finger CHC2-type domain-containing protein n=1 Tax=Candidatus Desulfatibia vada TaxID=2841696 RepID=A0A8J6NVZ2_9BACT|nr:hypothetical protein [Candidatus Desulfatibia vada]